MTMMVRGYKVGAKLIMWIALGVLILLLVTCGPAACNKFRSLQAQMKVNEGQAGAAKNSTIDAIGTQSGVNENTMASEELGRRNAEEIGNAQGARDVLNPEFNAASLRAFCRRRASRNDPKCRVLQPDPS